MFQKLISLFGFGKQGAAAPPPPRPRAERPAPSASPAPARSPAQDPKSELALPADAREFYAGLLSAEPAADLQALGVEDRVFVSGVLKLLREKRMQVPVMPQAALEISRLLSDPAASASRFAKVLETDPALSMDVLRIANSAYYGFGSATTSVRTAVVRIGLTQLRGLIIVTHLHGKVLQGGSLARQAGWLSELSLALAHLGQLLAPELGVRPDAAFTRGVLTHVEHFVILGAVAEVSREHKRKVQPTGQGLREAFARCGANVRELAAREWGLEAVLLGAEGEDELSQRFSELRGALLANWLGDGETPAVTGIAPERLADALRKLAAARGSAAL